MEKEKSPGTDKAATGAINQHPVNQNKDIQNCFDNPIRQRIFELFLGGGQYSVAELSELFHIPDPRSHIRYIRGSGYAISDYWVKSEFSRYKVYFLHNVAKCEWVDSLSKLF